MTAPLIAGNWKMNGLAADLVEVDALAWDLASAPTLARVAFCPPATLVERMARRLQGSVIQVGGQDCSAEPHGAFTGDISAAMLKDAGVRLVIVGHSERRAGHGESDAAVLAKALAALALDLEPIICVGETLAQRESGKAIEVVTAQIAGSIPPNPGRSFAVAYEPVWAIGTGLTPTIAEIEEVHAAIRKALAKVAGAAGEAAPILYGGSVKPGNAAEILKAKDVGGALVGGASLKAADFLAIIRAS